GEQRVLSAGQRVAGAIGDGRTRRIRLETSIVAALAAATGRIDGGVTDLARGVARAVVELAVENQAAADPRTDRDADHVLRSPGGADPPFAERGAIRVVVERRAKPDIVRDPVAQREVVPAEVRRGDHETRLAVERARAADADAEKVIARGARFRHGLRDRGLDHRRDALDDRVRALRRERRQGVQPMLAAAVRRHRADGDLRAAEVDAEDESCAHHGSNKLFNARETCSTSSSRMHFQCPSGHTSGPWGWHGRHVSDSLPMVAWGGASGPNPNSGAVGPKIESVGVPAADARCCGAESLVTRAAHRESSSVDASRESSRVALTPRSGPDARAIWAAGALSSPPPTTTSR